MTKITTNHKLISLKWCVIIPTYNNCKTLKNVIDGVLGYTDNIIVVNDGATDDTAQILKLYPQIKHINLPQNKGKGNALRIGFKCAESLGFNYAITIDSDGQHYPKDIPVFINALKKEENQNILLIGARNMNHENVPKKSNFGNKFSNFWFWFETGITLQDTQSGFRLYPLKSLKNLKLHTSKFEFEIEVIVKAAWRGVTIKNVPIDVFYDDTNRISHFRPLKDFTRISILNTWLVIVAIFYIKPRDLFRKFKGKGIKRFLFEDFMGSNDSPIKKALSIALGIFIGLSPLWGLQSMLVVFLAIVLKLNKTIAFGFSNISIPPLIPIIILASLYLGNFILGHNFTYSIDDIGENIEVLKHLKTYIIGSFSLAIIGAFTVGLLSYFLLLFFQKKKIALSND